MSDSDAKAAVDFDFNRELLHANKVFRAPVAEALKSARRHGEGVSREAIQCVTAAAATTLVEAVRALFQQSVELGDARGTAHGAQITPASVARAVAKSHHLEGTFSDTLYVNTAETESIFVADSTLREIHRLDPRFDPNEFLESGGVRQSMSTERAAAAAAAMDDDDSDDDDYGGNDDADATFVDGDASEDE